MYRVKKHFGHKGSLKQHQEQQHTHANVIPCDYVHQIVSEGLRDQVPVDYSTKCILNCISHRVDFARHLQSVSYMDFVFILAGTRQLFTNCF